MSRLITVAIHTYQRALALRSLLESEGIPVVLNNVNLESPDLSSGVRVRIEEHDLPLALRVIENTELYLDPSANKGENSHVLLIPVDFSENSYKACTVGFHLARKLNATIHLLYSYIDPYIAGNMQFTDNLTYEIGEAGARNQMEKAANTLMANFAERINLAIKSGMLPPVKFTHSVLEGVPEDSIVEYARMEPPYLIIMGTRGTDKKDRELIGSVTAEVLDEGRFTVLTVPEPVPEQTSLSPTNILFFSNLDQNDILAMDTLYRTFGNTKSRVTIVHVPKRNRFSDSSAGKALTRLSEYCRANFENYHFESVPLSRNADIEEFTNMQAKYSFDLIVVPNRRRNAFSRLFNPGLAHKILFQTDIPMLVIPV